MAKTNAAKRLAIGLLGMFLAGGTLRAAEQVTDEQVVTAMKKGIDYMLSVKKEDNWELIKVCDWVVTNQKGGQTALALYSLLHAAESLQDHPEDRAKLSWRGKELAPVIQWLAKNPATDTYVVGLAASAMTLVPKNTTEKPGEGVRGALEDYKAYLLGAMGQHGGYSYHSLTWPLLTKHGHESFASLWEAYCAAAHSRNKAKEDELKKVVDEYLLASNGMFGGQTFVLQQLIAELRHLSTTTKNPKYNLQLRALEQYAKSLPQETKSWESRRDYQKKIYDDLVEKKKKGESGLDERIAAAKRLWDKVEGEKGGFYPIGDLSNGQYGALGAWALTDFGIELPDAYWKVQDRFWRQLQWADGSWPYLSWGSHESKEAMGTAGIASLYVCQEFVDNELRLIPKPDPHIEKGLKWLEATYKPTSADYYYQYGVERIGLASGLKFFGTTNWYKEAATAMVRTQRKDGSWTSNLAPHITTPYVLLFLARGRNPVVFNKLQYNGHWNARPRDDANVTRWLSKRYEKPINWQVVNLQVSPEEWMDAPILLITGSADPKFTPADLAKLRTFIQAGGMIFSTADGNSPTFSTAIKKYANEVMDKKYEMRNLPKDHLLFSKELGVEIPNPPAMLGMSNGAREVWIHSTTDLGADWQMRRYANKSSFELGAALYFYASGRASLRSKLQPLTVDAGNVTPARTITVAQIDYPGNTEPEPGAWPRMAKLAKANFKTDLKLATLKPTELDPKKTPLAHMTGTTRIVFTQDDANALRTYLDAGGLLFVDSAAGSENFTASCKELFQKIYPDTELTALPPDHPIYTGSMPDGVKIDDIQFRTYGELRLQRKVRSPALEMLAINGKPRVIFSSWDVCSGFLGTNTWSIVGYAASTSEKLGRNIVLYATPNPQQQ